MNYQPRLLEEKLRRLSTYFPVIALTGARQVGKTTLLQHLLPQAQHITFDPVTDIGNARQDPEFFINHINTPILLDEIQYAPELLASIKRRVDEDKNPGQYWLTGSQNLSLLKNVAESLAGRVAMLSLYPMSLGEILCQPSDWINRFLQNPTAFLQNPIQRLKDVPLINLLWRGGYPGLIHADDEFLHTGLESYLRTYIERDVRLLSDISDAHEFSRFVQIAAHLTAQEINYNHLGRELGITPHTARRWLNILINTYQWLEIPAYAGNTLKRISGKSKGYLCDVGMACHLMHITTAQVLLGHPQLGALFETFIVQDIIKQLTLLPIKPAFYHWRSHAGAEVDLLLEINNEFFPIEIKCKTKINHSDVKGIKAFRETYPNLKIGPGLIIAPIPTLLPLRENCFAIPYDIF